MFLVVVDESTGSASVAAITIDMTDYDRPPPPLLNISDVMMGAAGRAPGVGDEDDSSDSNEDMSLRTAIKAQQRPRLASHQTVSWESLEIARSFTTVTISLVSGLKGGFWEPDI